jgi:membrane protein
MRAATPTPVRPEQRDEAEQPAHRSPLDRIKQTTLIRVIGAYGSAQVGSYAAGLAYNAFMSLFPLILGILAVLGLVLQNPSLQSRAETTIVSAFPASARADVRSVVQHLPDTAGIFAILAIVGLLWTGTNFFASVEFALGRMFNIGQRAFLRQRAMGVVMLVVLIVALLLAVGADSLMPVLPVMTGLGPVVGLAVLTGLMLLIYRYVPRRSFRFGEIWPGAVVAGVLMEAITLLFPLYGKLVHGDNAYGQSLALFFLLAAWIGFLSQFVLIGALWNRVRLGERFSVPGLAASPLEGRGTGQGGQPEPADPPPPPPPPTAGCGPPGR